MTPAGATLPGAHTARTPAASNEVAGNNWFAAATIDNVGCAQHVLLHFPVERCRCRLSRAEKVEYNRLLDEATTESDPVAQLALLMDAIMLCDDDAALHRACITLAHQLQLD